MSKELITEFISRFPIYQYGFVSPEDIEFSNKVRVFCKRTCRHYAESWSCPPAVGKIDKCREKCRKYTDVLVFSTVTEMEGRNEYKEKREAQNEHERLTGLINNKMRDLGYVTYVVSSSFCKKCDRCVFPRDYCRHPEEMYPCIESHGIIVSDLLPQCDMDYYMGDKLQLLFTLIFFKDIGFTFTGENEVKENA